MTSLRSTRGTCSGSSKSSSPLTTRLVPIGPSPSIRQPGRARHSGTGASSRPRFWEASIIATNGPLPDDPYFVARQAERAAIAAGR